MNYGISINDREQLEVYRSMSATRNIYMKNGIFSKKRRKKAIDLHKIIMLTLSIISSIIIIFLCFSSKAEAQETPKYKYYHMITVEKGDSLWSIANEYKGESGTREYLNEIIELNDLTDDRIVAGQTLLISYYSYEYKK